jgi:glycosyltransferase involved in cell wall biosynthesis
MLSQFYPPVIGGEERHVATLSQALAARGHTVSVATIGSPDSFGVRTEDGIRVHRLPTSTQRLPRLYSDGGRPHAPPIPDPELVRALRGVIQRETPDVVHAHNWIVNSLLPLRPWTKARMVLTLHDYSHVCAVKRLMRDGVPCSGPGLLKCVRCAAQHYGPVAGTVTALSTAPAARLKERALDAVIAVSSAVAKGNGLALSGEEGREGIPRTRVPVRIIPNFIPDSLWEEAGRPPDGPPLDGRLPAEPFLLFVGDLSRDKGVHVLLEAYARLSRRPPLVLMGRRCKDTPSELPDGVKVLDGCPHPVVMDAFRRCLAAVAPSVWPEPFGLVVLEAMTAGSALVAAASGGMKDIVSDRESGLMVPPGDAGHLHDALQLLVEDPELRRRLGAEARARARRFTTSRVVPTIEDLYGSLLGRGAPMTSSSTGAAGLKEGGRPL